VARPVGISAGFVGRPAARLVRRARGLSAIPTKLALALGLCLLVAPAAGARTLSGALAARAAPAGGQKEQLLLRSDSVLYDRKHDTVTAAGHVQIYYEGRILQADRVIYDRAKNRVYAEGHAKLTERDGSVAYGRRFELTDTFKSGFIDRLRVDTADKTHFTAARAERAHGETTELQRGTYTACQPCKRHPERPPLWQIRAKRIIHKNAERTIYYEDADLEFYGVPVAWLPFFSAPDPTVTRKSGVLAPGYVYKPELGVGVSVPYFFALTPSSDLTVTPTYYARQGLMLEGEWRHRLANGAYAVRASGIFQADGDAFNAPPFGARDRSFRGSLETNGQFYINDKWRYGWDVSLYSDKFYRQDYELTGASLAANYFKENPSTVYLTGQGDRGYFDLRGYYFQTLAPADLQAQQPVVAPVLDYDKTFDLPPEATWGIGGQAEIDANFTSLTRSLADYQSIGTDSLDQAYGLYNVCETAKTPSYTPGACLLRGIAGNYTRATANLSWKRKYIDTLGEVWTPFVFAHFSGSFLDLNTSNSKTFTSATGSSTISNASQAAFLGTSDTSLFSGQAVPGAGVEWRYPFIAQTSWATHILEPIAQVIVRPNAPVSAAQVNEDAQSLVFDDTNLFEWNKFSGYDRFEGGTRVNYGAQYALNMNNGGYANLLVGQSYQLAGQNPYSTADALAVGIGSGLATRQSDYVARLQLSPISNVAFIAKTNFDPSNFALRRLDLMANASFKNIEASIQYARYAAQPQIGYDVRREGLATKAKLNLTPNYYLTGDVIFDLSRHLYNQEFNGDAPLFSIAGVGVGGGFSNDCATFAVDYTSVYQQTLGTGPPTRNQTVSLSLELRTLGDTQVRSGLADLKVQDGLAAAR